MRGIVSTLGRAGGVGGKRVLALLIAVGGSFGLLFPQSLDEIQFWAVPDLQKVLPDDRVESENLVWSSSDRTVRLAGAAGEHVPFQVVVTVPPPRSAPLSESGIRLRRGGFRSRRVSRGNRDRSTTGVSRISSPRLRGLQSRGQDRVLAGRPGSPQPILRHDRSFPFGGQKPPTLGRPLDSCRHAAR